MKKSLFVITLAITMVSCGAKKAATPATPYAQEQEVVVPCAEYKSDKQALRAVASADAPNMQIAQRVTERYVASYDVNEVADAQSRYQDMTRQLAAKLMTNSTIVCDKVTKTVSTDGKTMFHAYVAVELVKEELLKPLEQEVAKEVTKDDKAQIDFDAEKFRAIFEQEFGK